MATCFENALSQFNSNSFTSGGTPGILESVDGGGTATISESYGQVNADLIGYTQAIAKAYIKVTQQTDGTSNNPPVIADNKFRFLSSGGVGSMFNSRTIGQQTPFFTISDCNAAAQTLGWTLSDQAIVLFRNTFGIQIAFFNPP